MRAVTNFWAYLSVGFAAGLTHHFLAGKPQRHPYIKLAAQAFLPNVWFVIR